MDESAAETSRAAFERSTETAIEVKVPGRGRAETRSSNAMLASSGLGWLVILTDRVRRAAQLLRMLRRAEVGGAADRPTPKC